ncbi:MAG: 23S rRNA (uracil(1939)-C(5))-methyltransferase RlmD, partial [Clostridiales bacterium]|nr:23S rRNA (uracil(1939)-C(5))-methyltransferase RlmD [Clostridiales bacterium]
APRRVVYVSCMPETLARDLKYLTAHGYRALEATPVDMFPHTEHVETVCLLSRSDAMHSVKIGLNRGKQDLTGAEKKMTRPEVKA